MSSAVCSSDSGESASVVAFSLPPPQFGRRSRSSGRAVATTRSGTSATQSTSSSTKSSRLSSAQWRSSKTRRAAGGRRALRGSDARRRTPLRAGRLRARVSPARPDEREQVRAGPELSSPEPASASSTERASFVGHVLGRVLLEHAGLGLDDLAERPQRHAVAVGETASLTPGDELRIGVDDALQLVDEAALPEPGDADEGDELRRPLVQRAVERVAEDGELAVAADELRPRLVRDVDAEAREGDLRRLPDGDRLALPLGLDRRRLAVLDRAAGSRGRSSRRRARRSRARRSAVGLRC